MEVAGCYTQTNTVVVLEKYDHRSRIEVRPTALTLTLTFNPRLAVAMTHIPTYARKLKFKGQSVQSDRVETDGRTDGRYRLVYLPGLRGQ